MGFDNIEEIKVYCNWKKNYREGLMCVFAFIEKYNDVKILIDTMPKEIEDLIENDGALFKINNQVLINYKGLKLIIDAYIEEMEKAEKENNEKNIVTDHVYDSKAFRINLWYNGNNRNNKKEPDAYIDLKNGIDTTVYMNKEIFGNGLASANNNNNDFDYGEEI